MKDDYLETIRSSVFDEYSLQDAIAALVREHALQWHDAKNVIVQEYDRGLFRLYKDGTKNDRHVFIDVDMAKVDFHQDDLKRIFLTGTSLK